MGHPAPTPPTPRIAQNANFFTLGPIYEKLVIFFPCYEFVCSVMRSYCPEILVHLVRRKGPQHPPNMIFFFLHILGLNLNLFYQMASLVDMYIDMGERIVGKQDRLSVIIEDPPNSPKYTLFFTFWPINEKLVFKLFPLVVHMSSL